METQSSSPPEHARLLLQATAVACVPPPLTEDPFVVCQHEGRLDVAGALPTSRHKPLTATDRAHVLIIYL